MCKDSKITQRLIEGVKIVAPPSVAVGWAIKLLKKDIGFKEDIDDICYITEYHEHYTTVKYNKTIHNVGDLGTVRQFIISIPNRYRPVEESRYEGVIYSEEEI